MSISYGGSMIGSAIPLIYKLVGASSIALASTAAVALSASASSEGGFLVHHRPQPSGIHSTARGCDGHRIGQVLRPGQCIVVLATGFAAGEGVVVRELQQPAWSRTTTADRNGRVTFRFTVPATDKAGRDVLTFVGTGKASGAKPGRGNLTVTVPRIATCRFTVDRHR
ncbi:MAG: hypothetical protein ABI140_20215 [Jatrophihabitantaceae bacterium]